MEGDKRNRNRSTGGLLREYRESGGVTLEEVSKEASIHWATLSKIEKGERPSREGLMASYERAVPKYAEVHAVEALTKAILLGINPQQVLKKAVQAAKDEQQRQHEDSSSNSANFT